MAVETYDEDSEDDLDEPRPPRSRRRADNVPDAPVENADSLPLLTHAGTGKTNTVTFLKIVRLDGPPGVRGFKGQMPPETTHVDLADRFGNGVYKVEGCNYRNKVLAREERVEISIPGYDDEIRAAAGKNPEPVRDNSGMMGAHGMKMISDMSRAHSQAVEHQARTQSENVREMAASSMKMVTEFTAAQRETERNAHETMQQTQQTFFASMMAMQQAAHQQQMEMLTAMHERSRSAQTSPTELLEVFMNGIKAAGELGGGGADTEPWLAAIKEGTGALGHLASIANSPAATSRNGSLPPGAPAPRQLTAGSTGDGKGSERGKRRRRLPFKRSEIRGIAQLKGVLRNRGIDFEEFLTQTTESVRVAPESDLFEDDDGPGMTEDGSSDAAGSQNSAPEAPTSG